MKVPVRTKQLQLIPKYVSVLERLSNLQTCKPIIFTVTRVTLFLIQYDRYYAENAYAA